MANLQSEFPELIDWLTTTIEPIQGQQWRIELNSSGGMVEAKASVVESKSERPNVKTTISRVTEARFRLIAKRIIFQTD